jgi:cation/acetate symporter
MSFTPSARLVNPRLGAYFAIFASAFVAIVLLALMLEQLGTSSTLLRAAMFAGPIGLYAVIGIAVFTNQPADYFAAGRRVPAFFNGLVLAITALGGAGFVCLTGTLFFIGFDALCLSIGWCAGLLFMAVLLVPFMRKFGSYSVPSYLGRRFDSQTLRIAAAAMLSVPVLLLLSAELRIAAWLSAWLLAWSEQAAALVVTASIWIVLIAGGMRSLTWSSAAKAIVALLSLAVLATIAAIVLTRFPLPQMTHGNLLRELTVLELQRGVRIGLAPPLAFDLPSDSLELLVKGFIRAFGAVGSQAFVLASFAIMAGIAASPVLLPRSGAALGVYEARKSLGWAILIVGFVLITLSAVAVFLRMLIVDQVVGNVTERLPVWFRSLQQMGIAQVQPESRLVALAEIGFRRDAAIFAMPIAVGFPLVLVFLALAGALAAALGAASASMLSLAVILAEDVVHGLRGDNVPTAARIAAARAALLAAGFVGAWSAITIAADPLQLFLWSLALSGSSAFAVLVLSIWWKRINAWGALAGMSAGFAAGALTILLNEAGMIGWPGALAGVVGVPISWLSAMVVSHLTPAPGRNLLEMVQETRVPGGETIYDREVRLLRLKNRQQT